MAPKPRVLVVDDEQVVRSSYNRVLSENGYSVNAVEDGPSALERLRRESFDLAFVDLRMPGMNGMEVVRSIRRSQPRTRVVVVTGYGTESSAREARDLGVFDFVAKPLAPEDLTGLAGRAMKSSVPDQPGAPAERAESVETSPAPNAEPATIKALPREEEERLPVLSSLGLLIRGMLLSLAYVIFLPFIGIGMLTWVGANRIVRSLWGARAK